VIRRALAIFRTFPSNPDIIGKRHLREKVHFTHIAARRRVPLAGKGSFPPYRCTPGSGTCGKRFISPISLHAGECHLREKVHFPHIAAPERFHARIRGKCTPTCNETGEMGGKPRAARAKKRSFPQHRCTRFPRCKDMGEMHGKRLGTKGILPFVPRRRPQLPNRAGRSSPTAYPCHALPRRGTSGELGALFRWLQGRFPVPNCQFEPANRPRAWDFLN